MPKKLLAFSLVGWLFTHLILMILASGGVSTTAEPVSQLATVDHTITYAETASKLGAPWDIVMLTDSIYAAREDEGSIEDVNPIHTSLQFAIMTVTTEHWECVDSTYDEETDTWDDEYDWVFYAENTYKGKDAILSRLNISSNALDKMDADRFTDKIHSVMENNSDGDFRYSATLSANYDVEDVLSTFTSLNEEEISHIIELYNADYLIERMDEDTQARVNLIMGLYGMRQHVDLSSYVNCEGVVFTGGVTDVTYYNQLDERWADAAYGTDKIGIAGCGPTSMSIVISSLTGDAVDPVYMSTWAVENGYWVKGKGSAHALIPAAAKAFGLTCSGCSRSEPQRIVDALERGDLVVALMTQGHFTNGGHFIVLRGVSSNGEILVADPASLKRSNRTWSLSLIVNESHKSAAAGGPFWIIGK